MKSRQPLSEAILLFSWWVLFAALDSGASQYRLLVSTQNALVRGWVKRGLIACISLGVYAYVLPESVLARAACPRDRAAVQWQILASF